MTLARPGLVLAFAGLGASGAGLPASVPAMAAALQVPASQALTAVPVLFGGLFVGVLGTPLLAHRVALSRVVALAAGVQALALASAAAAPDLESYLLAAALLGLGFGTVESAGAALARALAPQRTERLLTALTACVATVAALTPLLVAALATGGSARLALALLALPHVAAALVLARTAPGRPTGGHAPGDARLSVLRPVVRTAAALFFYVGAESVLAGWSAELPRRQLELDTATAALGTSAFWTLLTVGRLLAWALLRRDHDPRRLTTGSLTALALLLAAATALAPHTTWPALVATALAIVAGGPCYALLLGAGVHAAPAASSATTGATLVATGALGGVTLATLATALGWTPTLLPAVAAGLAAAMTHHATAPSRPGRAARRVRR